MTLPRTIHRRNARKRAKARPKGQQRTFIAPGWVMRDVANALENNLKFLGIITKRYGN